MEDPNSVERLGGDGSSEEEHSKGDDAAEAGNQSMGEQSPMAMGERASDQGGTNIEDEEEISNFETEGTTVVAESNSKRSVIAESRRPGSAESSQKVQESDEIEESSSWAALLRKGRTVADIRLLGKLHMEKVGKRQNNVGPGCAADRKSFEESLNKSRDVEKPDTSDEEVALTDSENQISTSKIARRKDMANIGGVGVLYREKEPHKLQKGTTCSASNRSSRGKDQNILEDKESTDKSDHEISLTFSEKHLSTLKMVRRRESKGKKDIKYQRRKKLSAAAAVQAVNDGSVPVKTTRDQAIETEEEERIRKAREEAKETYLFAAKLGIKGNLPEEDMIQIFMNLQNDRR